MKRLLLRCICLMVFLTVCAYGKNSKPNDCGILKIEVTNYTKSVCNLTNNHLIHGIYLKNPTGWLAPYETREYILAQAGYGPDIITSYRCGNKEVWLRTQQNFCFLKSGKITAKGLTSASSIRADYLAIRGSHNNSQPGTVFWKITE